MDWSQTYPPERRIAVGNSLEARAIEKYFRPRSPAFITLQDLKEKYPHDPSACLGFMTDDAYAFFLPAFIEISREKFNDANVIPEVVINGLSDIAEGRHTGRRDAILASYDSSQFELIVEFLTEMVERYWANHLDEAALRTLAYWKNLAANRPRTPPRESKSGV